MKWIAFVVTVLAFTKAFAQNADGFIKLSMDSIIKSQPTLRRQTVINTATMQVDVMVIRPGDRVPPETNTEDATWYVTEGNAFALVNDTSIHVLRGSVLYVKAGNRLQFNHVAHRLKVLAVFSKAAPSATDNSYRCFALDTIESKATLTDNDWEPFLKTGTLTLGLYMLPQCLGGDSTLVHKTDELNYVTKGTSVFTVDSTSIPVAKGDIVFVGKGRGHYFHNPRGNFNVLIWWERKSFDAKQ